MNYFKLVNISVQNSSDYGVGEILRKFFLILAEKTSIIWPEQFYLLETSFGKFFLFWLRKFFWIQSLRKRKFYFVWPKKIPLWERNKTIKGSWSCFPPPPPFSMLRWLAELFCQIWIILRKLFQIILSKRHYSDCSPA